MSYHKDLSGKDHPCAQEKIHRLNKTQSYGLFLLVRSTEDPLTMIIRQCSSNTLDFGLPPAEQVIGKSFVDLFEIPEEFVKDPEGGDLHDFTVRQSGQVLRGAIRTFKDEWKFIELVPERFDSNLKGTLNAIISSAYRIMNENESADDMLKGISEFIFKRFEFDRVMWYEFDADFNGTVLHEHSKGGDSQYLGLRFPASDIPAQARRLYLENTIRQIADSHSTPADLIPLGKSINLTKSSLRAVSEKHLEYMRNMGVRSSMSLTISVNGMLFGMFLGHNYSKKDPLGIWEQECLRMISQMCSMRLSTLIANSEAGISLKTERILAFPSGSSVSEIWDQSAEDLQEHMKADAVLLLRRRMDSVDSIELEQIGRGCGEYIPLTVVALALEKLELLQPLSEIVDPNSVTTPSHTRSRSSSRNDSLKGEALNFFIIKNDKNMFFSNSLLNVFKLCFKEATGSTDHDFIPAGMVFISCSLYDLVFLRKEIIRDVKWAGADSSMKDDSKDVLSPRNSFMTFISKERGKSSPWHPDTSIRAKCIRLRILQYVHGEIQGLQKDLAMRLANKRGEFLAHMSHELRTPFNGIIGMLDVLTNATMDEEDKECVHAAYQSAVHMLRILDDVLLVSKMDASKLELNIEKIDIEDLLGVIMKLLKFRAKQTRNRLCAILSDIPSCGIQGDPGRLRQIILNLLTNAMKFTKNGKIEIITKFIENKEELVDCITNLFNAYNGSSCSIEKTTSQIDQGEAVTEDEKLKSWFIVQVKDNGQGIGADAIRDLFKPFSQVEQSGKKQYQGTGLGLHISQNLVHLMGGQIFALSTEHEGTSFVFYIKTASQTESFERLSKKIFNDPDVSGINRSKKENQYSTSTLDSFGPSKSIKFDEKPKISKIRDTTGKASILVADDNLVNQKIIERMCKSLDIVDIKITQNGKEALEYYKMNYADIQTILLDIKMPIMDGWEALHRIRDFETENDLEPSKVFCCTADIMTDAEVFIEAGFDDVLIKPITHERLQQALVRG